MWIKRLPQHDEQACTLQGSCSLLRVPACVTHVPLSLAGAAKVHAPCTRRLDIVARFTLLYMSSPWPRLSGRSRHRKRDFAMMMTI